MGKSIGGKPPLGAANQNRLVAAAILRQAKSGNMVAAIWWSKNRMGWRDAAKIEHEVQWDLSKLSAEDLATLERLQSKAVTIDAEPVAIASGESEAQHSGDQGAAS
jgi:hypothetical protein